nr:hypothetical protein GCM10020093_057000 [Planobispora longispora]
MGHCLWTGIVDEDKAASVAEHLMSPAMFTGYGVRTLASTMGAYNPMSYHNGSIWPHDNALVAAGLMRYGFAEGRGGSPSGCWTPPRRSAGGCRSCSAGSTARSSGCRCRTPPPAPRRRGRPRPPSSWSAPCSASTRGPRTTRCGWTPSG